MAEFLSHNSGPRRGKTTDLWSVLAMLGLFFVWSKHKNKRVRYILSNIISKLHFLVVVR